MPVELCNIASNISVKTQPSCQSHNFDIVSLEPEIAKCPTDKQQSSPKESTPQNQSKLRGIRTEIKRGKGPRITEQDLRGIVKLPAMTQEDVCTVAGAEVLQDSMIAGSDSQA